MENKLFDYFKDSGKLYGLSGDQLVKFQQACNKAVCDNPTLDFNDLLIVCQVYLNTIRDFPHMFNNLSGIITLRIDNYEIPDQ